MVDQLPLYLRPLSISDVDKDGLALIYIDRYAFRPLMHTNLMKVYQSSCPRSNQSASFRGTVSQLFVSRFHFLITHLVVILDAPFVGETALWQPWIITYRMYFYAQFGLLPDHHALALSRAQILLLFNHSFLNLTLVNNVWLWRRT